MIRLFNRLLAFTVGVALVAGGVLVIVDGIWTWTNSGFVGIPGQEWLSSFKTTPWSATMVIVISALVAGFGLLLLLFELRPQRKRVITYQTDTAGEWLLLRRSTEGRLRRRLSEQVATGSIKARLKPRAGKWSLKVNARAAPSSRPVIETAARAELALLHAPEASQVRVKTVGAANAT
jgi:hypothetical protein